MNAAADQVASPCTGVCALDEAGLCLGCLRTGTEIAEWMAMDNVQRHDLVEVVLPARQQAHDRAMRQDQSIGTITAALLPLSGMPAVAPWNLSELAGIVLPDRPAAAAAVLVGLVARPVGLHVLLTRRTDALRHHAGQVSFPGGRAEPGDRDAVATALREAREEVGLAEADAMPLGYLEPLATVTGFRVLPVVATIDPRFVAVADPREVADVFEVPLAWLMRPSNLLESTIDFAGRARRVLEFRAYPGVPGQRIWGATASILFNLRQRLQAAQ